jgi:hypothetical protein
MGRDRMEVNAKVKELEDELKLLKAEIRNVLLDIREVILERSNPLGEEHESAFIRMDLNTTARAMAAEAGAHAAMEAGAHAVEDADKHPAARDGESPSDGEDAGEHGEDFGAFAGPPPETVAEEPAEAPEDAPAGAEPEDAGSGELPGQEPGEGAADEPAPKVIRRDLRHQPIFEREGTMEQPTTIPPMYQATTGLPPLSGSGSLSAWVTEAIDAIGPEDLERVIAMERLWGALPPNISRALAYLQELLQQSHEARPPWLKVMQDLDRLASL